MGKRIVAKLYTQGKFGRRLRETLDTDNKPYEYEEMVGEDRDIFELWTERGYFDPKLLEQ